MSELPANPSVLGLAGSGINEQGSMTFEVLDLSGQPAPGVTVAFGETDNLPSPLLAIDTPTAVTDTRGSATVSFHTVERMNPGVSEVSATVLDSMGSATAITATQTIPVRGAKPSAAHVAFFCDRLNLPVYTTTTQQPEAMQCHVALADRFSNPVGIPTTVTFYAEAGAIDASVRTSAFDANNPQSEGTAVVTFASDIASGSVPAEVDPMSGEPSKPLGPAVTVNPRDQLVTIIALVPGEEAFYDANGNGQYDDGELFVDMPDPFIDANDDNRFDVVTDGGRPELRFCSIQNPSQCGPLFSYGNGHWDAYATLWMSTHVVFTGPGILTNVDLAGVAHDTGGCMAPGDIRSVPLFAYDDYLNSPAAGTTFAASVVGAPGMQLMSNFTPPMLETLGVMTLQTREVAESDGGACVSSNGPACQRVTAVGFDDGNVGTVTVANQSPGDGGACANLEVQLTATNAHSVVTQNQVVLGQYQP